MTSPDEQGTALAPNLPSFCVNHAFSAQWLSGAAAAKG
jgi:hypothetical protein